MSGGEHGARAFIFESVGLGTYKTIERSSVPRQWTWEGDCRGEEILRLVENLQVGLKWSVVYLSRQWRTAVVLCGLGLAG